MSLFKNQNSPTIQQISSNNYKQETHFRACYKASLTVEAAIVLPIYLMVMVFAMFTLRIVTIQYVMGVNLRNTARQIAVYGLVLEQPQNLFEINYLESSITENEVLLTATKKLVVPFPIFGKPTWDLKQEVSVRRWTGYDPSDDEWDGKYVYVTSYGEAYHRSTSCPFLKPSIQVVAKEALTESRSQDGSIFYECQECNDVDGSFFYVTDYGTRYHQKLSCKNLKRTITRILYTEAIGYFHPCPKCGLEGGE